MKITLLGTGGPLPDPHRHSAAVVVQTGAAYLLFDTGRGVVLQSARANMPLQRVQPVFLTHHHYDHIGDLADVILTGWLQGRRQPLRIFGPPGTTALVTALMDQVYEADIAFRAGSDPTLAGWAGVAPGDVMTGLVYDGGHYKVFAETVLHGHGLDFPAAFRQRWICLGYRIEAEGKVVTISGDCVAGAGLSHLARDADVLVQCCYLAQAEINTPRLQQLARHTIACADTAGKIAREAGVKTLVLTHFRAKPAELLHALAAEVAHDYAGPIILGQDLLDVVVEG